MRWAFLFTIASCGWVTVARGTPINTEETLGRDDLLQVHSGDTLEILEDGGRSLRTHRALEVPLAIKGESHHILGEAGRSPRTRRFITETGIGISALAGTSFISFVAFFAYYVIREYKKEEDRSLNEDLFGLGRLLVCLEEMMDDREMVLQSLLYCWFRRKGQEETGTGLLNEISPGTRYTPYKSTTDLGTSRHVDDVNFVLDKQY